MQIIPSEIEKYCNKVGDEIHIEVDLEDTSVSFRFVRGKYEMHGNTAAYLSGQEILKLLELNGILGDQSEVKTILTSQKVGKDEKIHDLIYTTLAKYVVQMLNAAMAKTTSRISKPYLITKRFTSRERLQKAQIKYGTPFKFNEQTLNK